MQVSDTLILKIDKSKKKAFLEMLKWLDFVEVQPQKSVLQRFVKNAPKNIPLTYDDIVSEVIEHRYGKK
jgi:hypothetical protein